VNALAVALALGEDVHGHELAPTASVGGACVRFLVAPPGELRAVRGLERASAVDGVRGIRVYRRPGHVFHELRRASDRAGAILTTGDTREDALAAAEDAARRIRFSVGSVKALA
jgi:hypothetical protein